MPYIPREDRYKVHPSCEQRMPETPGELNYAITILCHAYLVRHSGYAGFNDVIGVLECAKLELYRRHVAPYEDQKIKQNGDVP